MLRKLADNLEELLCATFCAVMICCLALQVCVRALSGNALAWTEELSRYSFIWAVYMGMCLAAKRGAHVRITAQFLWAPLRVRLGFRLLADAICIVLNLVVAACCYLAIADNFDFPEISPTLGVVKSRVEMIIPVCFVWTSARMVWLWIVNWRRGTLARLVQEPGQAERE